MEFESVDFTDKAESLDKMEEDESMKIDSLNIDPVLEEIVYQKRRKFKEDEINKQNIQTVEKYLNKRLERTVDQTELSVKKTKKQTFFCQECGKGFAMKGTMKVHYKSIHLGINYPCKQCDFKASQPSNLSSHVKIVHEGIKRKRPIKTGS